MKKNYSFLLEYADYEQIGRAALRAANGDPVKAREIIAAVERGDPNAFLAIENTGKGSFARNTVRRAATKNFVDQMNGASGGLQNEIDDVERGVRSALSKHNKNVDKAVRKADGFGVKDFTKASERTYDREVKRGYRALGKIANSTNEAITNTHNPLNDLHWSAVRKNDLLAQKNFDIEKNIKIYAKLEKRLKDLTEKFASIDPDLAVDPKEKEKLLKMRKEIRRQIISAENQMNAMKSMFGLNGTIQKVDKIRDATSRELGEINNRAAEAYRKIRDGVISSTNKGKIARVIDAEKKLQKPGVLSRIARWFARHR